MRNSFCMRSCRWCLPVKTTSLLLQGQGCVHLIRTHLIIIGVMGCYCNNIHRYTKVSLMYLLMLSKYFTPYTSTYSSKKVFSLSSTTRTSHICYKFIEEIMHVSKRAIITTEIKKYEKRGYGMSNRFMFHFHLVIYHHAP